MTLPLTAAPHVLPRDHPPSFPLPGIYLQMGLLVSSALTAWHTITTSMRPLVIVNREESFHTHVRFCAVLVVYLNSVVETCKSCRHVVVTVESQGAQTLFEKDSQGWWLQFANGV